MASKLFVVKLNEPEAIDVRIEGNWIWIAGVKIHRFAWSDINNFVRESFSGREKNERDYSNGKT